MDGCTSQGFRSDGFLDPWASETTPQFGSGAATEASPIEHPSKKRARSFDSCDPYSSESSSSSDDSDDWQEDTRRAPKKVKSAHGAAVSDRVEEPLALESAVAEIDGAPNSDNDDTEIDGTPGSDDDIDTRQKTTVEDRHAAAAAALARTSHVSVVAGGGTPEEEEPPIAHTLPSDTRSSTTAADEITDGGRVWHKFDNLWYVGIVQPGGAEAARRGEDVEVLFHTEHQQIQCEANNVRLQLPEGGLCGRQAASGSWWRL